MLTPEDIALRLAAGLFFSGLIGWERERTGRAAGLRTHILIGLGSALVMLTSIHLFEQYRTLAAMDPGRIAAQVVSGIGFVGAGAIIQSRMSVKGLTTAASLWFAAGIGLASGSGFFVGAALATACGLLVLVVFGRVERNVMKTKTPEENHDTGQA